MNIAICAPVDIRGLARSAGQDIHNIPPGLGSTVTTPLIIELLHRGHSVTVYTLSNALPKETFYDWGDLRIFVGPSRQWGAARTFFHQETAYLQRVITADSPSFVHAHWTYEFALGALGSGCRSLITIHDLPWKVLRFHPDKHRAVRLLMAYLVACKGKAFTAVSQDAATHFRRYFTPGAPITVVPNFVDDAVFRLGRAPLPDKGGAFTFATIIQGWGSKGKNATTALKAFSLLRREVPDSRLLMIGRGYELGGPAERWAVAEKLASGVEFAGALDHPLMLERVHSDADAIVHPSLNESFSMAAVEGMALGKPVIGGSATPGIREVLALGDAGVLVNVTDPAAIAAAMKRLACDSAYRFDLAQRGYERASALYRSQVVVDRYESLYRQFGGA